MNLALDLFLGLAAGRASPGGKGISSKSWIVSGLDFGEQHRLPFDYEPRRFPFKAKESKSLLWTGLGLIRCDLTRGLIREVLP